MNTGIISTRYAAALLRYVEQTGNAAKVCEQAASLLANPHVESVTLEPELERFVLLLRKHGRLEESRFILSSFVAMYYKSQGIVSVKLITAVPAPQEIVDKLCAAFERKLDRKVHCVTEVDPGLVGGFTLIVDDDYMLDASVLHQLEPELPKSKRPA